MSYEIFPRPKRKPHPTTEEREYEHRANAGFLARHLRDNEHMTIAEAAALVIERYPHTRPLLERLTRRESAGK